MKRLVDVDLDLARVHVDERRDARAREAAAGRDRRDHLAGLRVLRDDDARERRADLEVLDLLRAHAHGGLRDVDGALERREARLERRDLRLRSVDVALAAQILGSQPLEPAQLALGFGAAHDDLVELGARWLRAASSARSSCGRSV